MSILPALLFVSSVAMARTWHVNANGTGDAPTIQAAIDSVATGDSVAVAAGLYDENLTIPQNKNVTLIGAGAGISIIDGGRRDAVVKVFGEGSLAGFTIRKGRVNFGAGVSIFGSNGFTVRNNTIEDNWAGIPDFGNGGGVYVHFDTKSIVIEANIIRNNVAGDEGGGVFLGAFNPPAPVLVNNVIEDNQAIVVGGGASLCCGSAIGNLITGNKASFGSGVFIRTGGTMEVRNNTIVNNMIGNLDGGAGIDCRGPATITHNIVANNGHAYGVRSGYGILCTTFGTPTIDCNDTWGNDIDAIICPSLGPNNFSADPLFCNAAFGDYTLSRNSPCLPAQNPSCGFIGAFPTGCGPVAVEQRSWGAVKSLFR